MNDQHNNEGISDTRRALGIIFLLAASLGLYWVVEVIMQLWNAPSSVPLISMFIDLMDYNQKPIIFDPEQSVEMNLPLAWPVVAGGFLTIVLISSISLLLKMFLTFSLLLLFPDLHTEKGVISSAFEYVSKIRNEKS